MDMQKAIGALFLGATFLLARPVDAPVSPETGERLFKENCALCHIGKMEGIPLGENINPRDLTLSLLSNEQMVEIVKRGTKHYGSQTDYMIGYEGIYSNSEIKSIVDYIQTNINTGVQKAKEAIASSNPKPNISDDKLWEKGRAIYLKRCIHCHGAKGQGDGIAVKASNGNLYPYDLTKTLLSSEQKFLFVKHGSSAWGTQRDDMPAWDKAYSDEDIHAVVYYIDELVK